MACPPADIFWSVATFGGELFFFWLVFFLSMFFFRFLRLHLLPLFFSHQLVDAPPTGLVGNMPATKSSGERERLLPPRQPQREQPSMLVLFMQNTFKGLR